MDTSIYYDFISQVYVSILTVALAACFWISFKNTQKTYLKLIGIAALVEAIRFIPDSYVTAELDNLLALVFSVTLQFLGTLLLLNALYVANSCNLRTRKIVIALLVSIFVAGSAYSAIQDPFVQPSFASYIQALAVILATSLLVWEGWKFAAKVSPSRILFSLASMSLLMLRSVIPSLPYDEYYLLYYYMEMICYPVILMSLILAEVENTNSRISDLLADKAQSEEDLKFIVNNTLDIILVANEVGQLRSWSQKAQEKFGYTSEQAVGKLHMDELFVGNHTSQSGEDNAEFKGTMESMDGAHLEVDVRMQTVAHKGSIYSIYVLRDTKTTPTEGVLQSLLEADEEEVINS